MSPTEGRIQEDSMADSTYSNSCRDLPIVPQRMALMAAERCARYITFDLNVYRIFIFV